MDLAFFPELDAFFGGLFLFCAFLLRYLVVAGGAFLVFYVWWKRRWARWKIQEKFPGREKLRMEILFSLSTFVIFALMGVLVMWMLRQGWTQLYFKIDEYGVPWMIASILLMILLHDTYFYWTHRLMHVRWIFPYVHKVHHLSNNPSPWSSFSFHPAEAVVEAGIVPLIAFLIPAHPLALLIFFLYMTVLNVIGHLGYELLPKGFTKHPLFKWSLTSTHHNMHHRFTKCNYGLYFSVWDRIMGTNHKEYDAHFEEIKNRS